MMEFKSVISFWLCRSGFVTRDMSFMRFGSCPVTFQASYPRVTNLDGRLRVEVFL